MDSPKNQITDRLNKALNVLVTVSSNPSVDQLASALGITLVLNKLGKHATAVFSGEIPSTIEFLQPEKTIEKTTDSLRDFIIALDKSKADKLRYKVEDQMVKIFITPYRTSISDKDLEFSQGDFNVDVVIAVGVNDPKDLDQAITAHGRILHDATVISVNTQEGSSLGSINWTQKDASSLCEMLLDISLLLKDDVLDGQMATAFLTGIVSETERFSNEKTSSTTMQLSAKLMTAGANQQLVASQIQPPVEEKIAELPTESEPKEEDAELPEVAGDSKQAPSAELADNVEKKPDNGTLQIDHGEKKPLIDINEVLDSDTTPEEDTLEQIHIDNEGILKTSAELEAMSTDQSPQEPDQPTVEGTGPQIMTQPPSLGGTLTANSSEEKLEPGIDTLAASDSHAPLLKHDSPVAEGPLNEPLQGLSVPTPEDIIGARPQSAFIAEPPTPAPAVVVENSAVTDTVPVPESNAPTDTLSDLEKVVDSPHQVEAPPEAPGVEKPDVVNEARDAVMQAVTESTPQRVEPIESLNAQPMDLNLGDMPAVSTSPASAFNAPSAFPDPYVAKNTNDMPSNLVPPNPGLPSDNTAGSVSDPTAPPPVPPPMMPPAGPSGQSY